MCVMITSALLRTETERWREEYNVSRPAGSYRGFLGRLGMTQKVLRTPAAQALGGAALAHTGLSFVPSGPASSSFLL